MNSNMRETTPQTIVRPVKLPRASPQPASIATLIPPDCLIEDLAEFAISMEGVLDNLERGRNALQGLECWNVEGNVSPEDQAVLQHVMDARQAIPHVIDAVKHQICGNLQQELHLLARLVGNPSWRICEEQPDTCACE